MFTIRDATERSSTKLKFYDIPNYVFFKAILMDWKPSRQLFFKAFDTLICFTPGNRAYWNNMFLLKYFCFEEYKEVDAEIILKEVNK